MLKHTIISIADVFSIARIIKKYKLQEKVNEIQSKYESLEDIESAGFYFIFDLISDEKTEACTYDVLGIFFDNPKELGLNELLDGFETLKQENDLSKVSDFLSKSLQ